MSISIRKVLALIIGAIAGVKLRCPISIPGNRLYK